MSFLDALDERYRLILCDIWGCVHDGTRLYPGVAERLLGWRSEGRLVVLITNAPRPANAVEQYLGRVGLPRDAWDAIASSGEAGIAALKALGRSTGFLGTSADREILAGHGLRIAHDDDFTDIACVGFEQGRWDLDDYRSDLQRWAARGVRMHCLNPDRVVVFGERIIPCAGAIADLYEEIGGSVDWYGKPDSAIYEHALRLAGGIPRENVLAVGDSLATDMLGAARMGFDAVFVTSGIHAGEAVPDDFAAHHGFGDWRPLAVVDSLG